VVRRAEAVYQLILTVFRLNLHTSNSRSNQWGHWLVAWQQLLPCNTTETGEFSDGVGNLRVRIACKPSDNIHMG